MADYYTQLVVQPEIPAYLLDEHTRDRLKACGLTCVHNERMDTYYLYSEAYAGSDEESVPYEKILQEVVVKSDGGLPHLAIEAALTCSKPRANGFGGYAMVITAEEIKVMSTSSWLSANTK